MTARVIATDIAADIATDIEWIPDPFTTDYERRHDHSLLLHPRSALGRCPYRMTDALEHWAAEAPDRIFVARRQAGGEWVELTYRETLARVRRLAAGLQARDLSAERPIAILSGNSTEHLLLALAATWAGIPYCPVSPSYSHASSDLKKLEFVLGLLTPGMIAAFDTAAFEPALSRLAPADVEIVGDVTHAGGRSVTSLSALESSPSEQLDAAHARTGPDSIVKFLLTSGSTGEPKAVITTERMLCSNAVMLRQSMPFLTLRPPVLVDWLPWNHTFGGSHNVGLVLFNGGSLYIDDGKPTPDGFTETLRNLREISPTVYFNVPKGFDVLAHHLSVDEQLCRRFYRRLYAYFFAGASLSQHTWDTLDAVAMRERRVKIPMLSGLGATETGPAVTFTTPAMGRSGVIGLPAAGNLLKLAPVEDKLEIRVRSPSVTPGYWRRPELTQTAFDSEGYYCLGDAVRLIDPKDPTQGLLFDGRTAEDFKLASGTWVSVGPLRADLIAALSPLAQDVVIAGLDCDYLAALIVPDLIACTQALELAAPQDYEQVISNPKLAALLRERLQTYAGHNCGSSRRVRRVMLLPSPPSLDRGEITDKGSINQRAVLRYRSASVTAMYEAQPATNVLEMR